MALINDLVWKTAERLVARHGVQAPGVASRKARHLLEQGLTRRRRHWLRVLVAAQALIDRMDRAA